MRTNTLKTLAAFGAAVTAVILPTMGQAQLIGEQPTLLHDYMDAKAARRDIARLRLDQRRARQYGNFSKAMQDQRLIDADRYWVRKDVGRIRNSGVW